MDTEIIEQDSDEELEKCPNCNSTELVVRRYGLTGLLGDVICDECGETVRGWEAY